MTISEEPEVERVEPPTQTYIYSLKCLQCGVHYQVYSWFPDWLHRHAPYCPECGGSYRQLAMKRETSPKFIFEFVSA
jgi:predicted nucleic acid-binding Zn ribbon protein